MKHLGYPILLICGTALYYWSPELLLIVALALPLEYLIKNTRSILDNMWGDKDDKNSRGPG